jgi:hypothetical protein
MAMIFPGMDPYLEDPLIWNGVHAALIVYIRDFLRPLLRPRYLAAIEQRVFVEGPDRDIHLDVWLRQSRTRLGEAAVAVAEADTPCVVEVPDLEIREAYINILDRQSGQHVVTVIEVVSPTNKYAGPGRDSYTAKQKEVRRSHTHLVEIDLLRLGPHVLAVPEWVSRGRYVYDYLVCVNRAVTPREQFELYPCPLRQRLPRPRIPLAEGDKDVVLDLQEVLAQTYEAGTYSEMLKYDAPCVPPLPPEDQLWANECIRQARQSPSQP